MDILPRVGSGIDAILLKVFTLAQSNRTCGILTSGKKYPRGDATNLSQSSLIILEDVDLYF